MPKLGNGNEAERPSDLFCGAKTSVLGKDRLPKYAQMARVNGGPRPGRWIGVVNGGDVEKPLLGHFQEMVGVQGAHHPQWIAGRLASDAEAGGLALQINAFDVESERLWRCIDIGAVAVGPTRTHREAAGERRDRLVGESGCARQREQPAGCDQFKAWLHAGTVSMGPPAAVQPAYLPMMWATGAAGDSVMCWGMGCDFQFMSLQW